MLAVKCLFIYFSLSFFSALTKTITRPLLLLSSLHSPSCHQFNCLKGKQRGASENCVWFRYVFSLKKKKKKNGLLREKQVCLDRMYKKEGKKLITPTLYLIGLV